MRMGWLALALRIILGGLFIWSGLAKVLEGPEFITSVANFLLLPDYLVVPVAYFLPWLELVCGAALVTGLAARGGAAWLTLLLVLFTLGLSINEWRGLDVDCGCFGATASSGTTGALIKNLILLPLSAAVLYLVFRQAGRR